MCLYAVWERPSGFTLECMAVLGGEILRFHPLTWIQHTCVNTGWGGHVSEGAGGEHLAEEAFPGLGLEPETGAPSRPRP